jgi:hypothetical protein
LAPPLLLLAPLPNLQTLELASPVASSSILSGFYLGEHRGRDLGAEREAHSLPEVTLHRTKRALLSATKCAGCKQARFPRHHAASSAVSGRLSGYTDLLHFIT